MVKSVNLRGINYLGSSLDKRAFCHFENVTYEFRAFTLNLLTKLKRFGAEFPREYINSYAPAIDGNNTDRYFEICAPLLRQVHLHYDCCMVELKRFNDDLIPNEFFTKLCDFYGSALALYRCQQVVESGYDCPHFSEHIDFKITSNREFLDPFPDNFGYFWLFGSNFTNLISWIYYSRFTLANKWLMIYLYTPESLSKPTFKSQLDLYHNELYEIKEQLHLEVVSDEDFIILSRHYAEQVRKFPISQSPITVMDYGYEMQDHPSASRVVTLHIFDHTDADEVFPVPREASRP